MSSAAFRAVNDVNSTLRGATEGYPTSAVLAVSSLGAWELRMNTGQAVLSQRDMLRHPACGAGSTYAATAYGIMVWGGQTCRPSGPAVTGGGELIALRKA
jgi:hypothetical protein